LHFLSISLGRTWIGKVWKLENNVWVEFYHWAVHSESCRPKRTDNYRNGKKKKVSYLHKSIKLFTSLHRQLAICFLPLHCCLLIVSPAEYVHNFVHCLHHMCCYHYSSNNVNQINVIWLVGWFIVFNVTFNNISVILWQSILLEEETGENHWPVAIHWQILSHYVVSSTPPHEQGSKSNYHTITTMTAPKCHLTCWIVITCLFMNKFNMNIFLFYFKFYLT
jgi:hypothetical protein